MTNELRLVVVGCGAITRLIHLPTISESADFRLVGLVDAELEHAEELASGRRGPWVTSDHRDAMGRADAAILAVPHSLHAPMAAELLAAGTHLLVEKPMALHASDCDRMIETAAASRAVLAVGLVRRFYEANRLVARVIRTGLLGRVRRIEVSEGAAYRWPMRSGFAFDRAQAGGGTLVSLGVHVLDLLSWWLGPVDRLEYRDDAEGGVEAECVIRLEFANGARGDALVTQLRDVPNFVRIELDEGTVSLEGAGSDPSPRIRVVSHGESRPADLDDPPVLGTRKDAFGRQLADFAAAIHAGRDPEVSGREGRRSVELLERCYGAREALIHPWDRSPEDDREPTRAA